MTTADIPAVDVTRREQTPSTRYLLARSHAHGDGERLLHRLPGARDSVADQVHGGAVQAEGRRLQKLELVRVLASPRLGACHGRLGQAAGYHGQALDLARAIGSPFEEARARWRGWAAVTCWRTVLGKPPPRSSKLMPFSNTSAPYAPRISASCCAASKPSRAPTSADSPVIRIRFDGRTEPGPVARGTRLRVRRRGRPRPSLRSQPVSATAAGPEPSLPPGPSAELA